MVSKTSSYHDALLESLADPREAQLYLNAILEDYPEGFLKALRNVAQARQMSRVAEQAGIKRESLYRALSDEGNPTLDTFTSILTALGLRMSIATPAELENPAPPLPHPDLELKGLLIARTTLTPNPKPTNPRIVDITRGGGLFSYGQRKQDEMEESTNEPMLQEALCG